jgi:cobalt-zinc-cadmium efflux system membrane fusion protein
MRATARTSILAAALVAACGQGTPEVAKVPAQEAAKDEHKEDASTLEIDQEMLRDLRITTVEVQPRPSFERAMLLGELAVDQRRYAEIGVPVPARVTVLHADTGERVAAGQVLAELTSPELGRSRADYITATARARLADSALDRKKALAAERIAPLREVQEAEAASVEAHAALRSAAVALSAFGIDPKANDTSSSATFSLRSPIAGWVIERSVDVGKLLDPATAAFRVGDLSTLWLTVHAFERDAVRIHKGALADLTFSALPGEHFEGTVTMIGRHVERESRTIPVRVDVRNKGGLLRPGMSATAAVPVGEPGVPILTVPVAAVQRVRNEWCVFLPKDSSHFEIRPIGRGRDLGGTVEILSGLNAGEKIVVDGAFLLKAQAEKGEGGHDDH